MYCEISFSASAFERLIKYRIADLFRPLPAPVNFPPGASSWLDGFVITGVNFNRVDNDRVVSVNELTAPGTIGSPSGYGYNASAVAMDLAADFFFARVEDVAAAGLSQPVVFTQSVPAGPIHITVRATVGANGIPMLQMELDATRLGALGLPASVIAQIAAAGSASLPFDIGAQLKGIFPPGNDKVLNAGITRDDSGAIVLRFTFPGKVWQSAMDHAREWQHFHSADFNARLGAGDWRMDLDGGAVAAGLASAVNPAFKDSPPIQFDSSWYDYAFIDGGVPRVVITKTGRIVNACAGNDVRFDAFANLDLLVPADNLLRAKLSFDFDKNDWDVAKCFGLTMLNPLSVFITAVDNGQFGIGLAELALSFVFPTKPALVIFALELLIMGIDHDFANNIVADRLKDNPQVTKLPGGFAFDKTLAPKNGLTNDWLVLRTCEGTSGRLLLGGELQVPAAILPRLAASDLEGISRWVLVDKCEPGKGQVVKGSLTLALSPGYGADPNAVPPAKTPTISLKLGNPLPGATVPVFQVLNDPLGIYQDPAADYTQIYFPGIPGKVEVQLKASSVRLPRFAGFANAPYPLRLRFYSNAGIREYEFAAPGVLTDFIETTSQMAERINKCKLRGADLLLRKYLELKWRVDPPDVFRDRVAQQWELHVRGLEPGRQLTLWNSDNGALLLHAFANQAGRVDISLLLRGAHQAGVVLMGLDERPFQRSAPIGQLLPADESGGTPDIAMQQTLLTEVDRLQFDERIESFGFVDSGSGPALLVRTVAGNQFVRSLPPAFAAASATLVSADHPLARRAAGSQRGLVVWRGKQRQFVHLSDEPGRSGMLAEYSARSAFDVAVGRHGLLAQLSSDGHRVRLFQPGLPVQFGSHEWEDDEKQAGL